MVLGWETFVFRKYAGGGALVNTPDSELDTWYTHIDGGNQRFYKDYNLPSGQQKLTG